MDLISSIANVAGALHPAANLIYKIYLEVEKIGHNKHQCKAVCDRAARIVVQLHESVGIDHHSASIQRNIEKLMS